MALKLALRSDELLKFKIAFVSPYFILYVKCPRQQYWQIVRTQKHPPEVVTDGLTTVTMYPVLLFKSKVAAEHYAKDQLCLEESVSSFWTRNFTFFQPLETFEDFNLPEEVITVTTSIRVQPVVYGGVSNAVTLPFSRADQVIAADAE